jgi:hypothetical protein
MNLQNRIDVLALLGEYLQNNSPDWQETKKAATAKNPWFTEDFIYKSTDAIAHQFLNKNKLREWTNHYHLDDLIAPKNLGIVMAGNIPMVGFHDLLSVFITGHNQKIKLSSKDDVLIPYLIKKITEWEPQVVNYISIANQLIGCDAYIATGGNQSAVYFEQYFSKYPNIIRRNRTSVAVLKGNESIDELLLLAEDIQSYFGLGCRNVTKIYVPQGYDFIPFLNSFKRFNYFREHNKYSNNYDYQLSILLLNNIKYMSNENLLLAENEKLFSPISVLHYEHYEDYSNLMKMLSENQDIQCIVGIDNIKFGQSQNPNLFSYADGVDTIQFLLSL